jgi:hypothetical protein
MVQEAFCRSEAGEEDMAQVVPFPIPTFLISQQHKNEKQG